MISASFALGAVATICAVAAMAVASGARDRKKIERWVLWLGAVGIVAWAGVLALALWVVA